VLPGRGTSVKRVHAVECVGTTDTPGGDDDDENQLVATTGSQEGRATQVCTYPLISIDKTSPSNGMRSTGYSPIRILL
jgi:hypothetical protein